MEEVNKTKVINVFEAFAGIGAQHKAIKRVSKENFKIVGTSEWDARAVIAYALIHNPKKFSKNVNRLMNYSDKEINGMLNDLNSVFSLNSKNPGNINGKSTDFKIALLAANEANNNHSDIRNLEGEKIKNVDLLTYSFPCQGLSIASMGRDLGIDNQKSTSHLIWQIRRILLSAKKANNKLPKYLLMENVLNLISKRHKNSFDAWIKFLASLGYKTFTLKLSGLDFNSIQNRNRLFALSIQRSELPKKLKNKSDIADIFQKYYSKLSTRQRGYVFEKIFNSSLKHIDEIIDAIPKNTPSRQKMVKENVDIKKDVNKHKYVLRTLTTKQDRNPNIGMIEHNIKMSGFSSKRFITTREAYLIMGFDNEDYDSLKAAYNNGIITKESLYRQAGNSIVVSKLEAIFKFILDIEKGEYE